MRVGIVGAGITGLSLHHALAERGVESRVFERAPEPGGVIRTVHHDGVPLDLGPQRTRLTPEVSALVDAAGVTDRLVSATELPLYVVRDGTLRRAPTTLRAAVATDLVSLRGKLRALLEPIAGPPRTGETVHGYLVRAFGREVADYFVGPLYGGLYGSDPADMPVEHSLARALSNAGVGRSVLLHVARVMLRGRDPPPVVSFDDGLQVLPQALYETYRDDVALETPITGIERSAGRYRIETDSDGIDVERVVLTPPAAVAASLLTDIDERSATALRRLDYNPLAVVHLRSDAKLSGAGFQIPFEEPYETLGCTWTASLFDRDGVYVSYLGGSKAPSALGRSDDELGDTAADEFEAITRRAAEPIHVQRLRPGMPAYDTSWSALADVALPEGVHLCTNYTDRAGIPGRVRAASTLADRLAEVG